MAALDRKARNAAKRLINKFGKAATYLVLTGNGEQVYNEETGLFETSDGYTPVPVKIAPPVTPTQDDLEGGQILVSDLKFEIAALGFAHVPKPNDRITLDGVDWTVKMVKTQYSGELVAYYLVFIGR